MNKSIRKKIPTILGILILTLGISSGVLLLNAKQVFKLGAEEDSAPKNIKVSNITDNGFTISFITNQKSRSFIKVGEDRFFLGDIFIKRQEEKTGVHYFDIDGLSPTTAYFIIINSDGVNYLSDNPLSVKTGNKLSSDNVGKNLYGKVYSKSGEELRGAIVYVQCGNGGLLSTQTSSDGSWNINISKTRTSDLSQYLTIKGDNTLIQVMVQYEQLSSFASTYADNIHPLPPIILGNNFDFRNIEQPPDKIEIPTPYVFGASTGSQGLPFLIQNIYKERQTVNNNGR